MRHLDALACDHAHVCSSVTGVFDEIIDSETGLAPRCRDPRVRTAHATNSAERAHGAVSSASGRTGGAIPPTVRRAAADSGGGDPPGHLDELWRGGISPRADLVRGG